MEAPAATTDRPESVGTRAASARRRRRRAAGGPDRASVILFSLAAFLAILAFLGWQLRTSPAKVAARPVLVVRRIYETTVVETIRGSGAGTSVSQSVSSAGPGSLLAAAPTTRSSPIH